MIPSGAAMTFRFKGLLGQFELDVAFETEMHGVTALFGPSAAGKTTVLRCVAGLERLPGELSIGGQVWQDRAGTFRKPFDRPIGYVFQEASLFPHLTVRENLLYGHRRALRAGTPEDIRLEDVVGLMGIESLLGRRTPVLSGGERQRVAIGRALLVQPRLLLMDEPLAALDRANKEEILPYLEVLHEMLSIPILYVTHDVYEVERLADRMVLMDRGRVVTSGPLAEVLADPRLAMARSPGAATVVRASVSAFDEHYGLTEMDLDGHRLLVPGRVGETGKMCRIRIAAADVSLARERPSQTSILNILPARILQIDRLDTARVNVVLAVGDRKAGAQVLARISSRAQASLGLEAGQSVYAQVKAVSLIAPGSTTRGLETHTN